jgi:hypothetical protein
MKSGSATKVCIFVWWKANQANDIYNVGPDYQNNGILCRDTTSTNNGRNGNKHMPTYTLKDLKTNNHWDVTCSWDDLQIMLNEQPDVKQVLVAPKIVSSRMGNRDMKVPDGFKDLQKHIKKGSGKGNTINT